MNNMDLEYFDEPRRCSSCHIVTYCDRCPICGKLLPRSNRFEWRLSRMKHIAGEEQIAQPKDHEVHRGHIKQRILEREVDLSHPYEEAEHVEPDIEIASDSTHTYRTDNVDRNKAKEINVAKMALPKTDKRWVTPLIIMFAVFIAISVAISVFIAIDNFEETQMENTIEIKTPIKNNNDEIGVYYYQYNQDMGESELSIINNGDRSFFTDIYLYNKEGEQIAYHQGFLVLPYEEFDLVLQSSEEASSYEMKNYTFYEINSTKPDFSYHTFNDMGNVNVYVEENLDKEDVKILVDYLYHAGKWIENGSINYMYVTTENDYGYEVYLYEDFAQCYALDDDNEIIDKFIILLTY